MNSNDFKLFKLLHVMDQLELPSSALASRGWQVLCAGVHASVSSAHSAAGGRSSLSPETPGVGATAGVAMLR